MNTIEYNEEVVDTYDFTLENGNNFFADGYLVGRISIKGGDKSTFIAKKVEEPNESIPEPPSYRDKWK